MVHISKPVYMSKSKDLEQRPGQGPMERGPKWRFRCQARAQWAVEGTFWWEGGGPTQQKSEMGLYPRAKANTFLPPFIYFNHYHSHSLFLRNSFYLNRGNFFSIKNIFFFIIIIIFLVISWFFFYFTILYWFCHTSTWIHHKYTHVPHSEPLSHLPPHTIPLGFISSPLELQIEKTWTIWLL